MLFLTYLLIELAALAIVCTGAFSWGVRARKRAEAREYQFRKVERVDSVYSPEFDPGYSPVKQPVRDPENNELLGYVSYDPAAGEYQLFGTDEV